MQEGKRIKRDEGYVFQGKEGRYRIVKEIGHGGLSTVYLVSDVDTNRIWALKEYDSANLTAITNNIIMEEWALRKLRHRSIPFTVDVFKTDDDTPAIVMEYVSGKTLYEILKERGKLTSEKTRYYMCQVCEVLEYLHGLNPPIIYRDVKPSNIIVRENGTIALIDFGTIREFKEGVKKDEHSLGTKEYASPEQLGKIKKQTDARSDIYSCGVTIYQLLTGKDPRSVRGGLKKKYIRSDGMRKIIEKCIAEHPSDRFQTARDLHEFLAKYRSFDEESLRKSRFKIAAFTAASAVAFALILAGVIRIAMNQTFVTVLVLTLLALAGVVGLYFLLHVKKEVKTVKEDKELKKAHKDENLDATDLLVYTEEFDTDAIDELEEAERDYLARRANGKRGDVKIIRKQVETYAGKITENH